MPRRAAKAIDEELAQSRARFLISCIVALSATAYGLRHGDGGHESAGVVAGVIGAYLAFSGAWYLLVRRTPGRWVWRRHISLFSDLAIMTVFMSLGGRQTALFYPLFLWIIIGNGIRFGERLLAMGMVMGTAGFGFVLHANAYWRANQEAGLGLLLSVVVLPVFFLGVLRRLQAMHELQVDLARSRSAEKAKDQFLAAMSHELRTPMNGVLGMAQTLNTTNLDQEQKEQIQVITRSVESLLQVIGDILDYSRISAQRLQLECLDFNLVQTLQDVVRIMAEGAREKGVGLDLVLDLGGADHFKGDPTRFRQIVFNLLGNAVKFTEAGSVSLICRAAATPAGPGVELTVSDTGIGIAADRQEAIFDYFEQGDNSTTRKYGGTGLGLAITRQLVHLMGGAIALESEPGVGSVFTVSLPLAAGTAPAEVPGDEPLELPDFGLLALVVEDNPVNQMVVRKILERIGVTCRVAGNGQAALDLLEAEEFDVVFMDIRMPVMNGYEATRAIRGRADGKSRVPILALTGEATPNDVLKCLEAGVDLHLAKPIRLEKIIDALAGLPELAARRSQPLLQG